jgi:hypothetical protein
MFRLSAQETGALNRSQFATGFEKAGTVTVAGKLGIDVPAGTHNSILKSAGLKK